MGVPLQQDKAVFDGEFIKTRSSFCAPCGWYSRQLQKVDFIDL